MRNWNQAMKQNFFCNLLLRAYLWGIETKLWSRISFATFCCEPTYEELKHEWLKNHQEPALCCEPTYEELKQWNPIGWFSLKWWLRAYLWGIETPLQQVLLLLLLLLRAYLWGIETNGSKTYTEWTVSCEPTYEELKRDVILFRKRKTVFVASLPMRNWNLLPIDKLLQSL